MCLHAHKHVCLWMQDLWICVWGIWKKNVKSLEFKLSFFFYLCSRMRLDFSSIHGHVYPSIRREIFFLPTPTTTQALGCSSSCEHASVCTQFLFCAPVHFVLCFTFWPPPLTPQEGHGRRHVIGGPSRDGFRVKRNCPSSRP